MEKDIKDFKITDDLDLFFNDFIKKGMVTKEDEVVPGFKIKVKVLSTGELLSAESIAKANHDIPYDVVQKIRSASILSQAILKINGIEIENDGASREDVILRRSGIYRKLLDMPAYVVQKAYDLYISAVAEQNRLYSDYEDVENSIENF